MNKNAKIISVLLMIAVAYVLGLFTSPKLLPSEFNPLTSTYSTTPLVNYTEEDLEKLEFCYENPKWDKQVPIYTLFSLRRGEAGTSEQLTYTYTYEGAGKILVIETGARLELQLGETFFAPPKYNFQVIDIQLDRIVFMRVQR